MSMVLSGDNPATAGTLEVVTQDYPRNDGLIRIYRKGRLVLRMSYSDFAIFAYYVLTNTVLRGPDDPRRALVQSVQAMSTELALDGKTPHRLVGPYPVQTTTGDPQ